MNAAKNNRVTMFRASDDTLHDSADGWNLHEARLAIKPLVNETLIDDGHAIDATLKLDEVSDFIYKHAEFLLKILTPLAPKKTRTPRVSPADKAATAAPDAVATSAATAAAADPAETASLSEASNDPLDHQASGPGFEDFAEQAASA